MKTKYSVFISLILAAYSQAGSAEPLRIDAYGESTTFGYTLQQSTDLSNPQIMTDHLLTYFSPNTSTSHYSAANRGGYAAVAIDNEGVNSTTAYQLLTGADACPTATLGSTCSIMRTYLLNGVTYNS